MTACLSDKREISNIICLLTEAEGMGNTSFLKINDSKEAVLKHT